MLRTMSRFFRFMIFTLCLAISLPLLAAMTPAQARSGAGSGTKSGANAGNQVTDIRMMRNPNGETRLILDINGAVHYRSFLLTDPLRLVVDLPNMSWTAPRNKGDRNNYIRSYRTGTYKNDTLRVVFDLNRKVAITSHERLSPRDGRSWQYIFNIAPADNARFNKELGIIHTSVNFPPSDQKLQTNQQVATPQAPANRNLQTTQTATQNTRKPLVIIDAGHGGVDPGAIASNGMYEKHITLAAAKELQSQLLATGKYRVHLTRSTDIFIKLPERVRIARNKGGDLFISLHADTVGRSNVQGASVYTLSNTASDAETAKLAERENAVDSLVNVDVGHVDADVADILLDLVTRDTMNQSKVFAETIVSTFGNTGVKLLQNPHRHAGFAVLKAPDIPSVLIEMGYLSNREEAAKLSTSAHRKKIATSIAKAIDRYFNETSKLSTY